MSIHDLDLVFARRGDGAQPYFVYLLEREARARGMSFLHCQNHDQAEALRWDLHRGALRIGALVDYMGRSFTHDYELGCAVKDAGGLVLDDPDRVRIYGDKAVMHQEMARIGLTMPRTLMWHTDEPSRDLTAEERAYLGPRIVCKPANGSGSGGVVLDMAGTQAALDDARDYDPDDTYLLQEFVQPLDLEGRPAWFRVYNCFGTILPCFWHPDTHATELVPSDMIERYGLHELARISEKIALISGYTWFSTEIALVLRNCRAAFLPIDYLNNKCFMLTHPEFGPSGMPVMVAEAVAHEIVEQTYRHKHRFAGHRFAPAYRSLAA